MKNARLFQILYLLLEKGTMTAPALAKALEVSVRTVYRDVEALSMAGVPITASAGKGGGIRLMEGYTFDKALLSDEEQNQLLFAIQSLQAADQQVGMLLSKLGSVFQKANTNWIEVDFSRWGFGQSDSKKFEQLKDAILHKQVLSIEYCGTTGSTSHRSIHPLKLVYKDKSWYLKAYCQKAGDYRIFKVSRILSLSPTGERFDEDYSAPPLEQQPAPYAQVTLRLHFSPRMAFRIYDEFAPACICPQPDSSLLVTVDFPLDEWVLGYLFSFGTELTILEPLSLRAQLAAYAEKIYQHHKS